MSKSCASDVQAVLSHSVYVVRVLLECHASVICDFKDCGEWVTRGVGLTRIAALKTVTCGLVLFSLLYGVISVSVDLLVDIVNLFLVVL